MFKPQLLLLFFAFTFVSGWYYPRRYYDTLVVGAGPGGVYTGWRLLTGDYEQWRYRPNSIAIVEGLSRPGGRVRPIGNDEVPEIDPDYVLELGAYRYRTHEHIMTRALVEDVLNIPTRCYSTSNVDFILNGDKTTTDCTVANNYYLLRNQNISAQDLMTSSANVPYFLRDSEKYAPSGEANTQPIQGFNFLFDAYPQILQNIPFLTDADPQVRWQAYEDVLASMRQTGVTLPDGTRTDGMAIDLHTYIGDKMSAEARAFASILIGNGDISDVIFSQPMYFLAADTVRAIANERSTLPDVRAIVEGEGRTGFNTWVLQLLHQYKQAGGDVFYRHEMTAFYKIGSRWRVHFRNGRIIRCKNLILNIGKYAINKLNSNSYIFTNTFGIGKKAIESVSTPVFGEKIYVYYPEAFWLNNQIYSASLFTDELFGESRIHDGKGTCDSNGQNCRGWLQVSYRIGGTQQRIFPQDKINPFREESLVNIIRASDDVQHSLFLDWVHDIVLRTHGKLLSEEELALVSKPTVAIFANWATADWFGPQGTVVQPSTVPDGKWIENLIEPVPGQRLHLVNLDFSTYAGWAEGSLLSGEKVLSQFFGLKRPSWLEEYWYKANIESNNI